MSQEGLINLSIYSTENGPTGFHRMRPLNKDISCSSVHGSDVIIGFVESDLEGVCSGSTGCSVASPDGVEAALEDRRGFFLGGIVY